MSSEKKENCESKEDPPAAIEKKPDKKEKQEAVCCFCPLRPCPLVLVLLITPILVLGMYSAFYDPHYVYVIVAYGIPSISGNNTDGSSQNISAPTKADASVQTEGEKIFYLPFENHFPQPTEGKPSENSDDSDQQNSTLQSKISFLLLDFPYYYRLIFYGDADEEKTSGNATSSSGGVKNVEMKKEMYNRLQKQKDEEDNSPVIAALLEKTAVKPVPGSQVSDKNIPPASESTALAIIDPYQEIHFTYHDKFLNIPNPNLCENYGENVTMLIGIHSFCVDFEKRKAIRESWGQMASDKYYKHVFFVGFPNSNDIMNRLMHESHKHHDIIQTSFIEAASTEAAQSVMFLKWVANECPKAQWVMKTEDDVFVNVPFGLYTLDEENSSDRTIYGFVDKGEENSLKGEEDNNRLTHNHHGSHHSVSMQDSKEDQKKHIEFIGGAGYILPGFLAAELYEAASEVPTVQYESLFITGVLAEKLNISRKDIPWFDASSVTDIPRDDPCSIMAISIIIHPFSADDMTSFWNMLREKSFNCGSFKYFAAKMKSDYTKLMYSSSLGNPKLNLGLSHSATSHKEDKDHD